MSKVKFDPRKPYSTRHGGNRPLYVQDGNVFTQQGKLVESTNQPVAPPVPQLDKDPKPEPKPIAPEDKIAPKDAKSESAEKKPAAKKPAAKKPAAKKEEPKAVTEGDLNIPADPVIEAEPETIDDPLAD